MAEVIELSCLYLQSDCSLGAGVDRRVSNETDLVVSMNCGVGLPGTFVER